MSTNTTEKITNAINSAHSKSITESASWGNYGWICPKCGAVMAPFVSTCINCRGNYINEITTNISTESEKSLQKELWKYNDTGIAPDAYYGSKPITYAEAHVAEKNLN